MKTKPQLRADSEAAAVLKAFKEITQQIAEIPPATAALTAERDQLRAELATLKYGPIQGHRDEIARLNAEVERLKAQAPSHEQRFAAHQSESAACLEIYNEWQAERFQSACNALAAHVRQQAHISANAEHAIVLLEQAVKEKNAALKLLEEEQDRAIHLRGLLEAPHADTALADERAIEIALLKQASVKLGEELARANSATDDALADAARADARTIKSETELRLLKSDHARLAASFRARAERAEAALRPLVGAVESVICDTEGAVAHIFEREPGDKWRVQVALDRARQACATIPITKGDK